MTVFNLNKERAARLIDNLAHDPDLVGLWPMNEQSGTIVDRCTKNRFNSTAIASTPVYSAALGDFYGLTFDGSDDTISFGNVAALAFERTDSFSVVCVIYITRNAATRNIIVGKADGGTPSGWQMRYNDSSQVMEIVIENQHPNRIVKTSNATLAASTSIMYGFSYDGTSTAAGTLLYKNGALDASTATTDGLTQSIVSAAPFCIGSQNQGTWLWSGRIGCVAVFNAVKTAADFKRWSFLGGFL